MAAHRGETAQCVGVPLHAAGIVGVAQDEHGRMPFRQYPFQSVEIHAVAQGLVVQV